MPTRNDKIRRKKDLYRRARRAKRVVAKYKMKGRVAAAYLRKMRRISA